MRVDGETIPYAAAWGETGALEAVTQFAETIDRLARQIEDVLLARVPAGILAAWGRGLLSRQRGCAG